jgi:superfamily II RNA helicase
VKKTSRSQHREPRSGHPRQGGQRPAGPCLHCQRPNGQHPKPRPKPSPEERPKPESSKPLKISPQAGRALSRIGIPEPGPFIPDKFQTSAVALAAAEDVIVSAPTGSGKTWIAQQAIAQKLSLGGRAWYASPLKALSNAKFLEFSRVFGEARVGLLTGDHKVNPEADLVIGTTEILRNQLYDAMSDGLDLAVDLVVLDEAHYLGDRERGVVWEEVLIYLPARVRLLLLSATVANAGELAAWLAGNRGGPVRVVTGGERPVPLAGLALLRPGEITTLAEAARRAGHRRGEGRRPPPFVPPIPNAAVMRALREADLLPAIFFLKSRLDCDAAAGRGGPSPRETPARLRARNRLLDDYLEKYPFLAGHPHLGAIRQGAVAAHHAGHLPHYKMLVEELMSRGCLDAIFATSTVSAGVNFPARTVVIRQSDRFDGQGFSDFSATEFTQMTGRAGRRGRDYIGFVLAVPGPHLNLGLLAGLMGAPPDPVRSALAVNFSMALNLLAAYRPPEIQKLLAASLAAYQCGATGPFNDGQVLTDSATPAADPHQFDAMKRLEKSDKGSSELGQPLRADPLAAALEKPDNGYSGLGHSLSIDSPSAALEKSFKDHLAFLEGEGLVTPSHRLTLDGQWAAELRLDHPLVFYAGVKAGAWPSPPSLLAGAVAALVGDKESNQPLPRAKPPSRLTEALTTLLLAVSSLMDRLERAGFAVPTFNLRPAWAVYNWAAGGDFEAAVALLGLGPGDMAMLALRTADHLRQLAGLSAHPELASAAKEARFRILREPVSTPL